MFNKYKIYGVNVSLESEISEKNRRFLCIGTILAERMVYCKSFISTSVHFQWPIHKNAYIYNSNSNAL